MRGRWIKYREWKVGEKRVRTHGKWGREKNEVNVWRKSGRAQDGRTGKEREVKRREGWERRAGEDGKGRTEVGGRSIEESARRGGGEGKREWRKGEREDEGGGKVGSGIFILRRGKRIS